jgi:Lecithin retinol acyltransferase
MANALQREADEHGGSGGDGRPSTCSPQDFPLGTHLVTMRRGYLHHGIYVGDGRVVHYSGLSGAWRRGPVEEVSLERFAAGRPILIKPVANARYNGAEVVARARSRLGEDRYRITSNNCEHFCEWCIAGEPRSEQVDHLLGGPLLGILRRLAPFARHAAADPVDQPADTCAV